MESSGLHQLQQIPGVGKTIARDMLNIGIDDLNGRKAEPLVLYFSDFYTTCFNWWMVTARVEAIAKQVFPPPVRQALFMCLKAPRPVN